MVGAVAGGLHERDGGWGIAGACSEVFREQLWQAGTIPSGGRMILPRAQRSAPSRQAQAKRMHITFKPLPPDGLARRPCNSPGAHLSFTLSPHCRCSGSSGSALEVHSRLRVAPWAAGRAQIMGALSSGPRNESWGSGLGRLMRHLLR